MQKTKKERNIEIVADVSSQQRFPMNQLLFLHFMACRNARKSVKFTKHKSHTNHFSS
jgi:hypothetical protein